MTTTDPQERASRRETLRTVRAGLAAFVAAAAAFALFGSLEFVSMAYDLPENAWSAPVVTIAERWHAAMETLGTAAVAQAVRDLVAGLRTLPWP